MTTGAQLGIGTKIQFETTPGASPVAWTNYPQALDMPPLGTIRDKVETTNQDSLNETREYIPALKDPGEFAFEANLLLQDAAQKAVEAMKDSPGGGLRKWRVIHTTVSPMVSYEFDAFVLGDTGSSPVADRKTRTVTLQVTGPITPNYNAVL